MEDTKKLYIPKRDTHKGDNGRILIIAGSKKYHGSALLAIRAAIPFVDLIYFYLPDGDAYLLQSVKMIPETIVLRTYKEILRLISGGKIDSVLIGSGLDKSINRIDLSDFVGIKRIIDADELKRVNKENLDKNSLLTPHRGEFERVFGLEPTKENVKKIAKEYNTNILLKGPTDYLSDGKRTVENKLGNPGMTKGGTGDALAGFITALSANNDLFLSAKIGVKLFCKAGDELFKKKKYYYTPSEIVGRLPKVMAGTRKKWN